MNLPHWDIGHRDGYKLMGRPYRFIWVSSFHDAPGFMSQIHHLKQ